MEKMKQMNKICKQYISEIKAFFPIMGKDEKKYIAKLKNNIESYCDEAGIATKEELYKNYGFPNNVVNDYYSSLDTDYIVKKIKLSKYIKALVSVILILLIVVTSVFCAFWYQNHQMYLREEAIIAESVIE